MSYECLRIVKFPSLFVCQEKGQLRMLITIEMIENKGSKNNIEKALSRFYDIVFWHKLCS